MALLSGIDLVVELPLIWSISSAQKFAKYAIKLIHSLECIDFLSFGSECNNIRIINDIIDILNSNQFNKMILKELKKGFSYATSRGNVVKSLSCENLSRILSCPNNILAIEYIKSLREINSNIIPISIKRLGINHDSFEILNNITSASNIRKMILDNNIKYKFFIPEDNFKILNQAILLNKAPAKISKLEVAILAHLRMLNKKDLLNLPDISEGLENRIYNSIKHATSLNELYSLIKSKRYALSRIRRIILNSFLGIKKEDLSRDIPYVKILGFNKKGKEILKLIKKKSIIPIVTKQSDIKTLDNNAKYIFDLENKSTDLYNLCVSKPQKCGIDLTEKIVII